MNIKLIIGFTLAVGLLTGCVCEKCGHSEKHKEKKEAKEAKLMAEAKVTKETAQATALAQVLNGTVKEAEIEKEKGKLIWSFDITTPDSKDIKEVNVDAITGDVVGVETETPEDQAKEAAEDAGKKSKDKEDKD
jgi:hypothetical protein